MSSFVPAYYAGFHCLAAACRHTCCAGWEIDIDSASAAFYRAVPGPFGEELRRGMAAGEDGCRFILTEDEKCPFLDREGLCRIYTALGEDRLCQICRDHPRFRNVFSSWTETGLGMCCEEAARVILSAAERAVLVPEDGENEKNEKVLPVPSGPEEQAFLAFRDRALGILWDRALPLEERFLRLEREGLCVPAGPAAAWREAFLALERLEDAWTETLENGLRQPGTLEPRWDLPLEQAAVYFLYRHLPGALEDGRCRARCALAVLLCRLLAALFAREEERTMERLTDLARRLSSEIEYSDRNIPCLLDALSDLEETL